MGRVLLFLRFPYFSCCLPDIPLCPCSAEYPSHLLNSILLYSHGRTHVPVWEPACTGILLHISACFYLTYSQSPFPLLHLKSRLLYGTRMLSEQWSYFAGNRSSAAFHADEKETGEKHVVFRCNPLTLCQNSNVQFPSKKQRICVKNTVMFKVPPCSQNLKTQHLKPSLFLTERF